MAQLDRITIAGFKSIRKLEDFELRPLNVLIGANGSGKSNFVGFFRLLREMVEQRLQVHIATVEGGADACLFMGPKVTREFAANLVFGQNSYGFLLAPTPDNRLVVVEERVGFQGDSGPFGLRFGSGHQEAQLRQHCRNQPHGPYCEVYNAISSRVVYHFHDTSATAAVRRAHALNDNEYFRPEADNLAPFLYLIQRQNPECYSKIRDVVRLAAPFFDDFNLRPDPLAPSMIQLEWRQRGSDYPFRAHQLSDGTLRFICMATALLQPSPPAAMLFDEPELGLHPYALTLVGSLFKQTAAVTRQIIVSSQSPALLSEFQPEDVIVVERENGESVFRRLDADSLSEWLGEYTLGELWQKNILGGRPRGEQIPEAVRRGNNGHS